MTIKLYEKDLYLKETKCKINDIIKNEEEILIVLDQTIFFPEGGGQPSDLGMIGDSKVLYVFEKDNIIYHRVDKIPEGKEVNCKLNWQRRLDHTQQHCGEHILSGVIFEEYGFHNKGFHLGTEYATIDIDAKELTDNMVSNIETKANEAIYENRNIIITTVNSKEEAQKFPIRKMPDINEDIRIVHIDGVDCVACCGTHPTKTGEVGVIKILKTQKYKGMTRIFFKCGKRALQHYQLEHNIISTLNKKYSSELTTLLDRIEKESLKNKALKDELNNIKKQLSEYESVALINESKDKIITKIYEEKSIDEINLIINKLFENGSYIIILCSLKEQKLVFTHDGSFDIDCGKIFKSNISNYNGRGGGNTTRAQGIFQNSNDMISFLEKISEFTIK